MNTRMKWSDYPFKDKAAYVLFWSWNIIFVAFMVLGFAPRMLPEVLQAARTGLIPVNFLIYALVLSCIPLAAVVLGVTVLRRKPRSLFALGYVVEGPLMLLLAVRFFLIRQSPTALNFVLSIALLGMLSFLWHLLDFKGERDRSWLRFIRLAGLTLMLLTSVYAAIWIAFYALPIAGSAIHWIGTTIRAPAEFWHGFSRSVQDILREGWRWVPFILLGFILVLYTATLFVVAPIAVPLLSGRAWSKELRTLAGNLGWLRPAILVTGTVILTIALFFYTNLQPQGKIFAMLEDPPASVDEAAQLFDQQEAIRAGLLNAYLAPFRYMSALGEVRHIRDIYEGVFNLEWKHAFAVQQLYEGVARPLLYDPVYPQDKWNLEDNRAFQNEPVEAAKRYQQFFDTPIADGERQLIVNAVRSTWSADRATQAWQLVDDREVLLAHQEVNVEAFGDWAQVELYEVYENQTKERQEVIYYFNLPESAVITGVWLGNSPDRDARFVYRIAPRGAAQAVYRNETRQNRDPALVEQIGPRQYRLRVFPVLPLQTRWDEDLEREVETFSPQLHMWLTYSTLKESGSWPMPHLAELRNVYWDETSVRLVDGVAMDIAEDEWLPESLPSGASTQHQAHRVDFSNGISVLATPAVHREINELSLPVDLQLALILDRSYSMNEHAGEVTAALADLEELRAAGATVEVYLTSSRFRGEPAEMVPLVSAELSEIFYYGGQNPAELLAQYNQLREEREYDAIIVLTDGSGYELGGTQVEPQVPNAPVWMVHLGGDITLGYDDATLEVIQASGGGVVSDLNQALTRLAYSLDPDVVFEPAIYQDFLDGYNWMVVPTTALDQLDSITGEAIAHTQDDNFAAIAARKVILAETYSQAGQIQELDTLDQLHALAKEYGIVTPYSSMIVLVDEQQEKILEHLEGEADRFEREYEQVGNTIPATERPLSGVPEPEEWLLLSLAVAMLAWYAYRRRYVTQLS